MWDQPKALSAEAMQESRFWGIWGRLSPQSSLRCCRCWLPRTPARKATGTARNLGHNNTSPSQVVITLQRWRDGVHSTPPQSPDQVSWQVVCECLGPGTQPGQCLGRSG